VGGDLGGKSQAGSSLGVEAGEKSVGLVGGKNKREQEKFMRLMTWVGGNW